MEIKPGLYRHFKGNYYQVIDVAHDSENQQAMVVYRALYGDKGLWVRPLSMFTEVIERDGETFRRFDYCENQTIVLEAVILDIKEGGESDFEQAFTKAQKIIISMPGCLSAQIKRCVEQTNRYNLLVEWQTIEEHDVGFRGSTQYQQWRSLLHHFFVSPPTVQYYQDLP